VLSKRRGFANVRNLFLLLFGLGIGLYRLSAVIRRFLLGRVWISMIFSESGACFNPGYGFLQEHQFRHQM
jgi:hypothetical protein